MNQPSFSASYRSSPNIAIVKYWGKYHQALVLPFNDSLGFTLNSHDLCTETSVSFNKDNGKDRMVLNKVEHPISLRISNVLNRIRHLAYSRQYWEQISEEVWEQYFFKIQSENSFPTASGMASSASGLACLAAAVNALFGNLLNEDELSELARLGSGSASRSVCGGLVHWKGVPKEIALQPVTDNEQLLTKLSTECVSKSVIGQKDLSFMKVIILLANNQEKEISSTSGMQRSMQTSTLIKNRNQIAAERAQNLINLSQQLIKSRQEGLKQQQYDIFSLMAENIIKDSNQFHAICLDTYPPIMYLSQFSQLVMRLVDLYLNPSVKPKIGYTFDAGPHCYLFVHDDILNQVLVFLKEFFGVATSKMNEKAQKIYEKANQESREGALKLVELAKKEEIIEPYAIWLTDIGAGCEPNTKTQL